MIAIAHDVLLAYLIEGDSERARRAARLIEREVDEGRQVYVSALVLARVATELTDAFGRSTREVNAVLRAILACSQLRIEDRTSAFDAVIGYHDGCGSYADRLARQRAFAAGCRRVYSFDEKLRFECQQP